MSEAEALRPRPKQGLGAAAMGPEELALITDVLQRQELFRYYGSDPAKPPPMASTLEAETRASLGVAFTLAVSSGTAALEIALAATGIGPGDEVIVPAWSWISCFTAIVRVGAVPVLAEIDDTLGLDPAELTRKGTAKTRAVLVIHYQGVAAEMDRINDAARARGWLVIEDCAEAPGVSFHGKPLGAWSDISIFSFQHNKPVTAGEGGLIATNNPRFYERAVRIHDLGQYRPVHVALKPATETSFSGGQFRMSELAAAVALAQWRKLPAVLAHCRQLQARILPRLAALKGLTLRRIPDPLGDFGFEIYFFLSTPADANYFRSELDRRQIWCQQRTGTYPQYRRDYVRNGATAHPALSPFLGAAEWPAPGYRTEDFPQTEDLTSRFVAVPIGWSYTAEDADHVAVSIELIHAAWLKI